MFDPLARNPVSRPSPVAVLRTDAGALNLVTPKDKCKKVVEGLGTPLAADSPAKNTRSVVWNIFAVDWARSPTVQKLHEQGDILISDNEEF